MQSYTQRTVHKYNQLYKKLYDREPRGFHVVNDEFVIVNDTQIRVTDLEMLNQQLEDEYQAQQKQRRSAITRLIKWLKQH